MGTRKGGIIPIEDEVIFARIYKLYNIENDMVYIGSTTKPLVKRLGDHMYSFKIGINMDLYHEMRIIGCSKFRIKLLDSKIVKNFNEMRALEQQYIDRENPKNLLNS